MDYIVTAKQNGEVVRQGKLDQTGALNLARQAMLNIGRMEETSADLRAMDFLNGIRPGKARVIENTANGFSLAFQIAESEGEA